MEQNEEMPKDRVTKLYYDAEMFKGNTFEKNINTVNKLYLGLGLKITDVPYIFMSQNDNNVYLSANCFTIENKDKKIVINYPTSFIYRVWYNDNTLYYLDKNNQLNLYKFNFEEFSIHHCLIQQSKNQIEKTKTTDKKETSQNKTNEKKKKEKQEAKKKTNDIKEMNSIKEENNINDTKKTSDIKEENKTIEESNTDERNKLDEKKKKDNIQKTDVLPKIETLKLEPDKMESISKKLEGIKKDNIKEEYEILCDILENDLKIVLNQKYPKAISEALTFGIKHPKLYPTEFVCIIKHIKYQIDSSGIIREKIKLVKGKVEFKHGISLIQNYADFKKQISFDNSFKSPIIYKNFEICEIEPNKAIMLEIKSGFDINELKRQLVERINAIKYFMFNPGEKPLYYIGIVNFDSKNKDKLNALSNLEFSMDENTLIVGVVDYEYFGIDLSLEVNDGYLLFKEITKINCAIEIINDRIDRLEKKIEVNFMNLFNELKRLNPNSKLNYITYSEKSKSTDGEEKKTSV